MREIPQAVKEVLDQAKRIEIKLVESNAEKLFDRHGLKFQKMAIESVLSQCQKL